MLLIDQTKKQVGPYFFFAISSVALVIFVANILNAPVETQVQYVPDDAFYYLSLAKNFSQYHTWTFDGGVTTTSGFHPLLAYLLFGIYELFPSSPDKFLYLSILLSAGIASLVLVQLFVLQRRYPASAFLILASVIMASKNFTNNTISVTEWPLVVFFSTAYFMLMLRNWRNSGNSKQYVIIFLVGFLGELARSDFGSIPFVILLSYSLYLWKHKVPWQKNLSAFWGFSGAVVGLISVLVQNKLFTNMFMQSSVVIKSYWVEMLGNSYLGALMVLLEISLVLVVSLVLLLLLFFYLQKRYPDKICTGNRQIPLEIVYLGIAGIFVIGGYLYLYSFSGTVQPWYSSTLIMPLIMSTNLFLEWFARNAISRLAFMLLMLISLVFNLRTEFLPRWEHQLDKYKAAQFLIENPPEGYVGSWNAGIINYFQGGEVINLDGLVNNDAVPYIVTDDLLGYIEEQEIEYIMDFNWMLSVPYKVNRGGYSTVDTDKVFIPVSTFPKDEFDYGMMFYRIETTFEE